MDESAGDPQQILQVLGMLARQAQCQRIFLDRLHYKSRLGKHLRQLISCRIETGTFYLGPRSYVLRIINLQSLFEKLAPELTRWLTQSHLPRPRAPWMVSREQLRYHAVWRSFPGVMSRHIRGAVLCHANLCRANRRSLARPL